MESSRHVGPTTIVALVTATSLWVVGVRPGSPRVRTSGSGRAVSVLLLSMALVLISSLPLVEEWFDGIDRAAIWHRRIAITGLLLLAAAHPARGQPDPLPVRRHAGRGRGLGDGGAGGVGDPAALAVRGAAAAARHDQAAQGRAGRPAGAPRVRRLRPVAAAAPAHRLFVAAAFVHGLLDGSPFPTSAVLRWSYVVIGGIGLAFYVYRELFSRFFASLHDYEVHEVTALAGTSSRSGCDRSAGRSCSCPGSSR